MMNINESLIIGLSFTDDIDSSVLLVGRQRNGKQVEVINAFVGEEAEELYEKLTKFNASRKETK